MKNVETIINELNLGNDVRLIRNDIADLIEHYLQSGKSANKDAALPYFVDTIESLALNINSPRDMSPVGLYTCLSDLGKAIAALEGIAVFDETPKRIRSNLRSIEQITYEFLIDVLVALRATSAFHTNKH